VDIGQLTLDDGQLCPVELEQALQGDSLLQMACSAGYYQLAQVTTSFVISYHKLAGHPSCMAQECHNIQPTVIEILYGN